jgi:hypothetical protein
MPASIKYELDGSPFFQQTGKMDSHLMALRAATDNMLREALVERTYNMLVNFPGLRVRLSRAHKMLNPQPCSAAEQKRASLTGSPAAAFLS